MVGLKGFSCTGMGVFFIARRANKWLIELFLAHCRDRGVYWAGRRDETTE